MPPAANPESRAVLPPATETMPGAPRCAALPNRPPQSLVPAASAARVRSESVPAPSSSVVFSFEPPYISQLQEPPPAFKTPELDVELIDDRAPASDLFATSI